MAREIISSDFELKTRLTMAAERENSNQFKDFKNNSKSVEELRRRRAELSEEIRKVKKEDYLQERRNINIADESSLQEQNPQVTVNTSMEQIFIDINSGDINKELTAARAVRCTLSEPMDPHLDISIDANIVPKLVEFLHRTANPDLQFEAARALSNITSGTLEQTKAIVSAGAVPGLISLLGSPHPAIIEQAVRALSNITQDCYILRDCTIEARIIWGLINLVRSNLPTSCLENITRTFCNLCKIENHPCDVLDIKQMIPSLSYLINNAEEKVLSNACLALLYLTDGPDEVIQIVVNAFGVVTRLIELLNSSEEPVIIPILGIFGNIAKGSYALIDSILANGCCPLLPNLLKHSDQIVVKQAAWTVSNIAARNSLQIKALISNQVIEPLLDILAEGHSECQKEAAEAVANITLVGSDEQIALMYQLGAIPSMCALLEAQDEETISLMLDAIANILATADRLNELERVSLNVKECGGLARMERLKYHDNVEIQYDSLVIIEEFFTEEDDNMESS